MQSYMKHWQIIVVVVIIVALAAIGRMIRHMLWRRKKSREHQENKEVAAKEKGTPEKSSPKYEKPKVLLVDLPESILTAVRAAGFNARLGTFGNPYKVPMNDGYQPVALNHVLPNYAEQEVVIIDLTAPKILETSKEERRVSEGTNWWWCRCNQGKIDPRLVAMYVYHNDSQRIFDSGGLFVVFAQPRSQQDIYYTHVDKYQDLDIRDSTKTDTDNWSFLSFLSSLKVPFIQGNEMKLLSTEVDIKSFLKQVISKSSYTAGLRPESNTIKQCWTPLLVNKFEDCVGGMIIPETGKGRVLILPQIPKDPETILTLLREVLPSLSPHLFPDLTRFRWLQKDKYELNSVLKHKRQKDEVRKKTENELAIINKKIEKEREQFGFLHEMITQTDENLVDSVESYLKFIGFKDVVNVDKEMGKKAKNRAQKQEDLQVKDRPTILILEVKGLTRRPGDTDTGQVLKYVTRRMTEWGTTDVHGVAVINHQRHIPGFERTKPVFMKHQKEDAEANNITLVNTWDLFLLTRGMMKYGWPPEAIQDLFYVKGVMSRIPTFYKPLGTINNYYKEQSVIAIKVSDEALRKGQRVAYITPERYLEEEVSSIKVDRQSVEKALTEQLATIKTIYPSELLKRGMIVYTVAKHCDESS